MTIVGPGVGAGYILAALAAGQTPVLPVTAGNILWLRADRGIARTGAQVSGWADFSGQNNHAAQTVAADQPEWGAASGVNGTAGVTLDAANTEWMNLVGMTDASTSYTAFCVLEQTGATAGSSYAVLGMGTPDSLWSARANQVGINDGSDRLSGGMMNGEQWLEWHLDSGAPSTSMFRDGSQIGEVGVLGTIDWANTKVGRRADAGTAYLNATISELIVYNRILSAAELAQVRAYIAARYALAWDINSIAGDILWLQADAANITVTGAGVSTWVDRSPEGNHASQAADADRPAWLVAGGVNGLGGVEFDAANTEWLDTTGMADASNDYTVFAVLNQTTTAATQTLLSNDAGESLLSLSTVGTVSVGGQDGTAVLEASLPITGDQWLEMSWRSGTTAVEGYRNGSSIGTDTYDAGSVYAAGGSAIGAVTGGAAEYADCVLSELIVFNRLLTAEETAAVRAYIATRYALAFSPLSVADAVVYLEPSAANITLNGADVASWANLGSGADFAQGTAAQQPLYVAGALPRLTLTEGDLHHLVGPNVSALFNNVPYSLIAVSAANGAGTDNIIGNNAVPRFWMGASYCGYDAVPELLTYARNNNTAVRHFLNDGVNCTYRENGAQLDTAVRAPAAASATPLTLGQGRGLYMNGDFYEMAAYDRALTAEEIASLETYYSTKYASVIP